MRTRWTIILSQKPAVKRRVGVTRPSGIAWRKKSIGPAARADLNAALPEEIRVPERRIPEASFRLFLGAYPKLL